MKNSHLQPDFLQPLAIVPFLLGYSRLRTSCLNHIVNFHVMPPLDCITTQIPPVNVAMGVSKKRPSLSDLSYIYMSTHPVCFCQKIAWRDQRKYLNAEKGHFHFYGTLFKGFTFRGIHPEIQIQSSNIKSVQSMHYRQFNHCQKFMNG